jgi:hypothetical protein
MRPGSRPRWRRCAGGDFAGGGWMRARYMATGGR